MASQCLRPGCARPAKNKYCSIECSRKRNSPLHVASIQEVQKFDKIPDDVVKYMKDRLGSNADVVLGMMSRVQLEQPSPTLSSLSGGRTWGDWDIGIKYNGRDYRPREALSYDKIKWMNEIGICQFILNMKLAPAIAPFRDENGWMFVSPDKELAEVATAGMRQTLPRFAIDFGRTSMENGHAPFEQTYYRANKYQLGLSKSRSAGTEFTLPGLPRAINPERLRHIDRDKNTGEFMGFTVSQPFFPSDLKSTSKTQADGLPLSRREALIITYQEQYRNLYGHSFYESLYPLAAMYEVAMRAMMRYIDRVATPVVVAEGPFDIDVTVPVNGVMTKMSAMEAALLAAVQASISNAVVIPANTDPETKEKLFSIYYLEAKGGALQSFIDALEHISQDMFRAGMAADRALTQTSGGVGSYNIGEVHQNFTLVHSDMILTQWVWALNQYWFPYISEYNRGTNGPPLTLVVQLLDPRRREAFSNMLNAMRDHPAFKELGYWADWKQFARTNNVPIMSEKDRDAILEETRKRAEEAMEMTQRAAQKAAEINAKSESGKNGKETEKTPTVKKVVEQTKLAHKVFPQKMPLVLGEAEWNGLKERSTQR